MKEQPVLATFVRRSFAGQPRKFELRIDEIGELETLRSAGIAAIFWRLCNAQFYHGDVRETVRLGLIGGGMGDADATALIGAAMDRKPIGEFLQLAADILSALINGCAEDDAPKKAEAERPSDPATSPPSMKRAARSASTRGRSAA